MVIKSHVAFKNTSRISEFEETRCKNLGVAT